MIASKPTTHTIWIKKTETGGSVCKLETTVGRGDVVLFQVDPQTPTWATVYIPNAQDFEYVGKPAKRNKMTQIEMGETVSMQFRVDAAGVKIRRLDQQRTIYVCPFTVYIDGADTFVASTPVMLLDPP